MAKKKIVEKPTKQVKYYYDWIECERYIHSKYKISYVDLSNWMDAISGGGCHNGSFVSVDDSCKDENTDDTITKYILDEFGEVKENYQFKEVQLYVYW